MTGSLADLLSASTPSTRLSSIGIRFDRHQAEARACILSVSGSPFSSALEIGAAAAEPIPFELLNRYREVELGNADLAIRTQLASETTAIATRLSQQLIAETTEEADGILAVGIHGEGIWHETGPDRTYISVVQPAEVAERLGKTVIDDFPARDLALKGRGGPVDGPIGAARHLLVRRLALVRPPGDQIPCCCGCQQTRPRQVRGSPAANLHSRCQ